MLNNMRKISNFDLKIIALILMTTDHIGYYLFPEQMFLRYIGRISFPIFAFLMVETYKHSSNITKKMKNLFVVAVIIQILFWSFGVLDGKGNIMFTLLGGLILIHLYNNYNKIFFFLFLFAYITLNIFFHIDYGVLGILIVFAFSLKDFETRFLSVSFILLFLNNMYTIPTLWSFLSLVIIAFYNGKLGTKKYKYLFYIYYPLHLIILYLISKLM